MFTIVRRFGLWLMVNTPVEVFAILLTIITGGLLDRWRHRKSLLRLRLRQVDNLILPEQVVIHEPTDRRPKRPGRAVDELCCRPRLMIRDLPGEMYVEPTFTDIAVIQHINRATKERTLANPVLALRDEGWPEARKQLFGFIRSACSGLSGYRRHWYLLIPTCWRTGDRVAIRVFAITKKDLKKFLNDEWWSQLIVEEERQAGHILALRQAARLYFDHDEEDAANGTKCDFDMAHLALPTDHKSALCEPIRWSTKAKLLDEVGVDADQFIGRDNPASNVWKSYQTAV